MILHIFNEHIAISFCKFAAKNVQMLLKKSESCQNYLKLSKWNTWYMVATSIMQNNKNKTRMILHNLYEHIAMSFCKFAAIRQFSTFEEWMRPLKTK